MSWTGNEEDLEEFICPITNDIFKDPVLASDGKTYEREGIELWMTSCTQRRLPITSPLTREQMGSNLMEDTEMVRRLRDRSMGIPRSSNQTPDFKADMEGIPSIHELSAVFAALDPLRDLLSETLRGWRPPSLVVIGQESCGKSTLLERISMFPIFPRDSRLCTRLPMLVRLRNSEVAQPPRLEVVNKKTGEVEQGPFAIPTECGHVDVRETMENVLRQEALQGKHGVSTERMIILSINNPHVPSIDLYDMPGLVSAPPDMRDSTRAILEAHIKEAGNHSLFLLAVDASEAPNVSKAVELIHNHDLESSTVGVFTICDEVPLGRKRDNFRKRFQNHPPDDVGAVSLNPHGWVACMNAPPKAADSQQSTFARLRQQAAAEAEWFRAEMPDLVSTGRAGCGALIAKINRQFLNNLKCSWGPKTVRMLKDALHRASLVNARLGLPACHEPALATSNKVRRLAVAHAQSLLKEGVSALYEEACREVLRPLKARILDIVCKDLTLPPDQLAERWVTQKHSLQAACHDAVEKWGDFLLSGLRALLVQTLEVAADLGEEMKLIANPPFKLLRFASFVSAILDHLARHLQAAKRDILETVAHCALQFFDRMSPWVHIETDLESSPIMVRVRCSNVDLTEAIIFAFVRQGTAVVLQQMPLRLVEIANGVADWVEDCSQERRDTLTRMQKLEYAMNQIVSLLGAGSTEELLRTRMVGSVRGPLHPIGSHGTGPTNFQFPYGVTVDLEGRLVVADTLNNRVQVMHGNGTLHLSIGKEGSGEGSGPGEFRQPVAVTTTPAGLIAVVEQQGNRIQLFNGKGVLVRTVGKAGTGPCCFNNPAGVACDSGGMLYVADRDNNRIQVLREDGTFLRFIGSQGTGKGQVRRPVGITIDHESNLVIAEGGRVQVLRPDGRHVRYVGETSPGLLKNPVGVAVDAFGRIYISDLENHRVEVFEPEGKVHLVSIGSEGIGSGQFKAPRGIAVDRDGVVVIADCKNHRLQLFRDPIGSGRLSPDSTTALDNNRRGSGV